MKPVELVILMRDKTKQALTQAGQNVDGLSRDYDELIRAIRASESEMERSGNAARKMTSDYGNLQSVLAKVGGTAALIGFGKEIIKVRSEFQNTEAMFKVFLGDAEKAAAFMKEIQSYAFHNVFEFKDLTGQAAQLLAYGTSAEKVISVLDKLSNVATGVNQPLEHFVELYNKAKSKGKLDAIDVQQWSVMGDVVSYLADMLGKSRERTRELISEGRIGFKEMDQLLTNLTESGGKFSGMMEEKMKKLGDSVGLLQDSITSMFNELGEKSEDFLCGGILLTNTLVENYETVGKILLSLIATYGAYKAAVVLATVAESGWTVAQMAHFNALLLVEKAQALLNKTMLSNPYVLVATVIVGLVTTLWALKDSTTAEEKALNSLNQKMDEYNQKADERKNKADQLIRVIKDETETEQAKLRALKELQDLYPKIFSNMDIEAIKLANEIDLKKKRNQEEEKYTKEQYKQTIAEAEARKARWKEAGMKTPGQQTSYFYDRIKDEELIIENAKKALNDLDKIEKEAESSTEKAIIKNKTYWEQVKKEAENALNLMDTSDKGTPAWEEQRKKIIEAQKHLDKYNPTKEVKSDESAAEKARREAQQQAEANQKLIKNEAAAALDRLQIDYDLQQKLLDIEKDGFDKRLEQLSLDYRKELLAVDKHERELIEKQQEIEHNQWEKDGKKGVFTPKTTGKNQLPQEQQDELETQAKIAGKTYEAATKQLLKDQLEAYRTFAQQRLDIEEKYQKDIADLRKAGASEENIQVAEKAQSDALEALDEEMAQKEETFKDLMMRIGYMSLRQLEKALRDAEQALKESEATNDKDSKQTGILRAKIKKLQEEIKAVKAEEEVKNSDPVEKWKRTSKAIRDCKKEIDGILSSMDFLDEAAKDALKAASNVAEGAIDMIDGVKKLGAESAKSLSAVEKASVILAIVGAAVQIVTAIFNMASAAEERHQEALKEVARNKLAFQRQYNLLLLEQNLLLEEASTIFGEKQIEKAANAMKVYRDAIALFKQELQGNKPNELLGMSYFFKDSYQKQLDAYNQGIGALNSIAVKTGHEKTGLFGWGKGHDIYSSILDVYGKDKLLNPDGSLNIGFTQTILDTRTLSDENKNLLQTLIDLQKEADKAQEALRDYLQETFGVLGSDLMDSIVSSIQDKGVNAWEAFGDAGAKVIENLGKQLAYELFFANRFAQLQEDLKAVYGKTTDSDEIARQQLELVGQFYQTIGNDMDAAKSFMEDWQKKAAEYGFDLWQSEGSSQSGKAGAFTTMTQDQGTKLEGLFTSVQMHTANIDEQVTDMSASMYEALDTLMRIMENTEYCKFLEGIAEDIAQIKRDGLKVK